MLTAFVGQIHNNRKNHLGILQFSHNKIYVTSHDPVQHDNFVDTDDLHDSVDHIQAHLHGVPGVVRAGLRQPGHAVVAVAQDLYTQTLVLLHNTQIHQPLVGQGGHR